MDHGIRVTEMPRYVLFLYLNLTTEISSLKLDPVDGPACHKLWCEAFSTLLDQVELTLSMEDVAGFEILAHLGMLRVKCVQLMLEHSTLFTPHQLAVASCHLWQSLYRSSEIE